MTCENCEKLKEQLAAAERERARMAAANIRLNEDAAILERASYINATRAVAAEAALAALKDAVAPTLKAAQDVIDAERAYNRAQMTTPWASRERDKTAGNLMSAERTLVLMAKGLPSIAALSPSAPASLLPDTECEACEGTGWYGDNGPGIKGNREYHRCDQCGQGKRPAPAADKKGA